ncbi:MAG: MBL fold metallo-hydrolase [Planctomycetota bacterium]|nr:MAG: MBL fold metallo-hydrolase [Planctomycetota bacterium]
MNSVVPGLYELPLGQVNVHLLETRDGLILIDTGMPGNGPAIEAALQSIDRSPADIRHIVVTHCHWDHSGSLAEVKQLTGASVIMHATDAAMIRQGETLRPLSPGPGLVNKMVYRMIIRNARSEMEPVEIERDVTDGESLPGGLRAIHAPGHCAGQIVLYWPEQGGVLLAADSCASFFGLAMSPAYEDLEQGRRDLARIARETFEVAVFGHGKPITSGASERFRKKWA